MAGKREGIARRVRRYFLDIEIIILTRLITKIPAKLTMATKLSTMLCSTPQVLHCYKQCTS